MRCQRCGTCCQVDASALLLAEDLQRWRAEGRGDLLRQLTEDAPVWLGDQLAWPDGHGSGACRFLVRRGARHACRIYATRPVACRAFGPGSSPLCPLAVGR